MLREQLRDMDLRITELADYLQISRPTMYKFIEYYERCEYDTINKKVLKLFNYISEHELVGKKGVINFIFSNLIEIKELNEEDDAKIFNKIKKSLLENPESKKSIFLKKVFSSNKYDALVFFLADVDEIYEKDVRSEEEVRKIELYETFLKTIKKTKSKDGKK